MKLVKWINRIPRPVRAFFCLLVATALFIVFYLSIGPAMSFTQHFRRAEKVHLVGPSTIVDRLDGEYAEFDKMIVGETEEGICFFGRYYNNFPYDNPFDEKQYFFSYVRKTGDLTLAAAPNVWGYSWDYAGSPRYVPVYLFSDDTQSVGAEIEITVEGTYSNSVIKDRSFTETLRSGAYRCEEGYFLFALSSDTETGLNALNFLSSATGGGPYAYSTEDKLTSIIATVRLYDAGGTLLREEELTIFCSKE